MKQSLQKSLGLGEYEADAFTPLPLIFGTSRIGVNKVLIM